MQKTIDKEHLHVAVIGPRQSGKKSLINRLFELFGGIKRGRSEHTYDDWKADVVAEKSIDLFYYSMDTTRYYITYTAVVGHPKFVGSLSKRDAPNVAFLIVSAVTEEFDKSCKDAIDQLQLLSNFGVPNVIVFVTKMDLIQYDQAKFSVIRNIIENDRTAKKLKFRFLKYLPVSSVSDLNLTPKPGLADWYTGPNYRTLLDTIPKEIRPENRPLRFPIEEIYKIAGIGYCATGVIYTGTVSNSDEALIAPEQYTATIKGIENHHDEMTVTAGTNVGIYFKGLSTQLRKGQVVGLRNNHPPKPVKNFTAILYVSGLPNLFNVGQVHPVKCHHALVDCKITDLIGKVDPQYGTIEMFSDDQNVNINDYIIVRFEPTSPLCVERYSKFPYLGKLAIQNGEEPLTAKGLIIDLNRVEKDKDIQ